MGFTTDLLGGVATKLAAAGAGTYNPTGVYTAGQTGIVFYTVPAAPERLIVLSAYDSADDPAMAHSDVMIQVRVRGGMDPRTADDLDDAVFAQLHNLPPTTLGGVRVTGCWRTSAAYIGTDGNGRHEKTSNYRATVWRPALHRL